MCHLLGPLTQLRDLLNLTSRALRGVCACQAATCCGDCTGVCTTTSSLDSTACGSYGTRLAPLKPAWIFSFVIDCSKAVLKAGRKVSLLI
ncbi:hypothetical protein ACJQWK_03378 [Exserohilum turcicum]